MFLQIIRKSGKLTQFICTICVNILGLVYGFLVGWAAPTLPRLSAEDSPLPSGPLTENEVSLIVSIMMLGGLTGTIIFGWQAQHFGRKWPLFAGMLPQLIALILIVTAQNTMYLYFARFFSGVSAGILFAITAIYVNEISENSIRGTLGSIQGILYNTGLILAYAICSYMPFYTAPFVALGILACFTLFIFFPESPQYLLLKHRYEEAEKSLKFFRGYSSDDQVKQEFESLKSSIAATNTKTSLTIEDFKSAATRKAILISYIILSGRHLSGILPLMNYIVDIFALAGSDIDPNISAIIVSVIHLVGTVIAAYYTDKSGRRILLIPSIIGVGLCLTVMGIYYFLNERGYELSGISWLPVLCLSGAFFLGAAVHNIPFYVMSEMLPTKIRSSVFTVFLITIWPQSFLILQYYSPVANILGVYGCMWIFAGWNFFEAAFAYIMLPETKGKTVDEIVLALEGKIK